MFTKSRHSKGGPASNGFAWKAILLVCVALWSIFSVACEMSRPLRIGLSSSPGHQYFRLAEERGFFTDEDVQVRLLHFESPEDARMAFERGQIDTMCCTLPDVLTAHQRSVRKPKVALIINCEAGLNVIVARQPDLPPNRLKNPDTASKPDTLRTRALARTVQQVSVALGSARLIPMAAAGMSLVVPCGEIEAAVVSVPAIRELVSGEDAGYSNRKPIRIENVDVWAVAPSVINERRSDMLAMIRAFDRAIAFAEVQPHMAVRIMSKYTGASSEEFVNSLRRIRMVRAREQISFFARGGLFRKTITSTASALGIRGQRGGPPPPSAILADIIPCGTPE